MCTKNGKTIKATQQFIRRGSSNHDLLPEERDQLIEIMYNINNSGKLDVYSMNHESIKVLIFATIIGEWSANCEGDKRIIEQLSNMNYSIWEEKVHELICSDSDLLKYKNEVYYTHNRDELIKQLKNKHIIIIHRVLLS